MPNPRKKPFSARKAPVTPPPAEMIVDVVAAVDYEQPTIPHNGALHIQVSNNGVTTQFAYAKPLKDQLIDLPAPAVKPDEPIITAFTITTNRPHGFSIVEYKIGKFTNHVYATYVTPPYEKFHAIEQLMSRMHRQYMVVDPAATETKTGQAQ